MRPLRILGPGAVTRLLISTVAAAALAACAHRAGDTVPTAPGAAAANPPAAVAAAGAAPATAAASGPPASPAFGGAAPGAARPASAAAPTPPGPPSFASIIKDARRIDGPLTLWQKEDKVWIELAPERFNQPFLLSPKIKNGIGEAWVLGGLMLDQVNGAGGTQVVEFVRVHNQVRLQARNTDVVARPGTPEARAVAAAYSASLLGSTAVASQPHPERKSVLIEANPLFLSDLPGIGLLLQRNLRQGYALDRGNSHISAVRGSAQATVIETQSHYYNGGPSASGSGLSSLPAPALPRFLPDSRSMLIGLNYSLSPLPAAPMATRPADPRLGLFTTTVLDFSDDLQRSPRQRVVNRWRLEKKDPAAEVSPPVKPITFWIDRNVPLAYRDTVRSAILEWNKAFEKIGFKDAIDVQQQPDDASFDTLDMGYSSVRWMMNATPAFGAIGPSHVDPRSGEILDADIAFEGMAARSIRGVRSQVLGVAALAGRGLPVAMTSPMSAPFVLPPADADEAQARGARNTHALCLHGALAGEQLGYALDVLEARGELDPDSPVAQQFVLDYVKDSIMHEVGHALGLRHNFRASRVYTEAQLSDTDFTRANGTTGSVMEYNAVNLPRPGRSGGVPFQTTLGPYDYWAIEYAYRPLPAGATPADERVALQAIAARSAEPLLAYGTDEDSAIGLDPETLQLDLGSDPIAFASKRLDIARDLFRRQESRELPRDRDYAVLRRSIGYALADAARAVGVLARQIGGLRTLRDFPGTGRDPLQPVPAGVQRQALDLIARSVFAPDGLSLSPALQRRMAPDFLERGDGGGSTEYSVAERLLELQRAALGYLMSDVIAGRVLDGAGKVDRPAEAFGLVELYGRLSREIWSDLSGHAGIAGPRRELQREHVNRLASTVVRPAGQSRAAARGLLREQARGLLQRLDQASRHSAGRDAETRAHLADSADTLRQAFNATLPRLSL